MQIGRQIFNQLSNISPGALQISADIRADIRRAPVALGAVWSAKPSTKRMTQEYVLYGFFCIWKILFDSANLPRTQSNICRYGRWAMVTIIAGRSVLTCECVQQLQYNIISFACTHVVRLTSEISEYLHPSPQLNKIHSLSHLIQFSKSELNNVSPAACQ